MSPCQGESRGSESRLPLHKKSAQTCCSDKVNRRPNNIGMRTRRVRVNGVNRRERGANTPREQERRVQSEKSAQRAAIPSPAPQKKRSNPLFGQSQSASEQYRDEDTQGSRERSEPPRTRSKYSTRTREESAVGKVGTTCGYPVSRSTKKSAQTCCSDKVNRRPNNVGMRTRRVRVNGVNRRERGANTPREQERRVQSEKSAQRAAIPSPAPQKKALKPVVRTKSIGVRTMSG